jgi:hypothetical protein
VRVPLRARLAHATIAIGLSLSLTCSLPASALAWANGPQYGEGFGTHDWVLYHANQNAVRAGYNWVDWPTAQSASDDPDMVVRDFYYHVYDRTGDPYGDSPVRVAALYGQAVGELSSGDRIAASRSLGLLSHYLSDTTNPLHTDQTPAEKNMHSRYEDALDDQTASPGADAALLSPHTAAPSGDAAALTRRLASDAHADYAALVSRYLAQGNSPQVQAITARSLNAAVGGVADTIAGISADAGELRGAGSPGVGPGAGSPGGKRGAGSLSGETNLLPGDAWCAVEVVLGVLVVAVLAIGALWRMRWRS